MPSSSDLPSILPLAAGTFPFANSDAAHVLLVVDGFPKVLGGGERIALRLAHLLQLAGLRVSILTFLIHSECTALHRAPCPVYLLPLTRTYDLAAFKAALQLRRFLRVERVRIVQTFFESSDLWAGLVTKLLSSAALIWNRRDMGILRGRKHHLAYRLLARLPDRVFTVSEGVRRHAIEVDRVPPERVHTIYNGVDLAQWPARPLTAEAVRTQPYTIVTLGNIRQVKGHDILLEAAAIVLRHRTDVRFEIIGDVLEPAFFAALQQRVAKLRLNEHVRFHGGSTDPGALLRAADIFVLPSRSEGFSNAVLEAMAASLPVIATDVGGNAEAVDDQYTGFVVPPENPQAIAAALLEVLASPGRLRSMSLAARERLEHYFTTDSMLSIMLKQFNELLSR